MAIPKAGPAPLTDLAEFLEPFGALVRRSESRESMERYATGLLSDLGRKTAADLGRALPGTNDQRLQEFLTNTAWDFRAMDQLRIDHMLRHASVGDGALVVDDTGFPKKGRHSVGVARQYSGTLGRVDNCQVMVTAHYVDRVFDWPVNGRLYLPKNWADDRQRRTETRTPEDVLFRTKGEIALALIDEAEQAGLDAHLPVVADAGYGDQPTFLDGLEHRKHPYVVGLGGTVQFRLVAEVEADPGDGPSPAHQGRGRPRKGTTLVDRVRPREARAILAALPQEAWMRVAWREGRKGALVKEVARVQVHRTGSRGKHLPTTGWLVGERPLPGHVGDEKQYFAWALDELILADLIEVAHVRWVIERFYQDAKGELGLDDYEGRLWTGLHRHVALVMLTHCFLTLRQSYGPDFSGPWPPGGGAVSGGATSTPPARGFPPSGSKQRGRAPTQSP
jgi:SRSO17 transposase